jgi:small-conductance mechanosensitive channel
MTQPIRIEDGIVVEGEFGNVEEITSTYVVVRLWDLRRMVLPLSYFIEKPFQNWTREPTAMIGAVMLYVDYRAPVAAIRAKAEETVKASPRWDGQTLSVQVTELTHDSMQIRILASSKQSFDLRCEIRERLIDWLQREHPEALPRQRSEAMTPRPAAADRGGSG